MRDFFDDEQHRTHPSCNGPSFPRHHCHESESRCGTGKGRGEPGEGNLAGFLEGRIDDNSTESKRIEVRRLPAADGQSRVRLRFAHAGTDSWYFGLDNVGFYSINPATPESPTLTAGLEAGGLRLTWPAAAAGFILEQRTEATTGAWTPVPGVSGTSALIPVSGDRQWFRLRQP